MVLDNTKNNINKTKDIHHDSMKWGNVSPCQTLVGFWWMMLDIRHQFMKHINLVIHSCKFILDVNRCVVCEENTEILQWRHDERDGVSNHQPHDCLLNRLVRAHQSPASLAFVRGIYRWPTNFSYKRPVTRKIFPSDDVIMIFKW